MQAHAVASAVSALDGHSEYSQYSVSAALQVELARRGIGSAYKAFTGTTDEIMLQKATAALPLLPSPRAWARGMHWTACNVAWGATSADDVKRCAAHRSTTRRASVATVE